MGETPQPTPGVTRLNWGLLPAFDSATAGHVHIEFAGTTFSFDIDRREAGYAKFRDAPFDPARARVLLRLARVAFPDVRAWTEQIVDAAYDPRTKLLAAIHGEPRCRAAWS